jgi:multidrug efflux system membrane fusion protein
MDTYPVSSPPPLIRVPPPSPRRRSRKALGVFLVLAAIAVGLLLWRHPWTGDNKIVRGPPDFSAAQSVTVAHAALGDMPVTLTALGTVTSLDTATIKSQISGYLTQIAFQEGQDVKKGDFLAQVDPRPYQAVLEQYQGNLLRDQALLRDAQIDLARYQNLSRLDSISRQNVDTQAAAVAQYTGAVKTDQGLIDGEKLQIEYAHITAPADGRLGLRQVDNGNYVTPGDTNGLVVLTQLKPISVIFTVPQTQLGPVLLRLRQTALPVTALASDNVTVVGTGTVQTIDNQIDTTTGTVKLRAIFPNDDETLFPNQFVNTLLLVNTVRDAIVVPNEAVQRGTPGTYVYLVGADRTVSLRKIAIGDSANGKTVVTSGLAVGDTVVIDGTSRLRAGSQVSIVTIDPKAQAAADEAAALSASGPPGSARRTHRHRPSAATAPAGPGAGGPPAAGSGGESGAAPPSGAPKP